MAGLGKQILSLFTVTALLGAYLGRSMAGLGKQILSLFTVSALLGAAFGCFGVLWAALVCSLQNSCVFTLYFKALYSSPMKKYAFLHCTFKALLQNLCAFTLYFKALYTSEKVCIFTLYCKALLQDSCAFTVYFKALYSSPVKKYAFLHCILRFCCKTRVLLRCISKL